MGLRARRGGDWCDGFGEPSYVYHGEIRIAEMIRIKPLEPYDESNQTLESNVHPPDWTNPTPAGRYNLVVIGAGTAGLVTAAGAAGLGARVALVERS